jgi:formylglycine-generating enzyme required for sulfatase activity
VPATDIPATELAAVVRAVRTRAAPDRPRPQRFAAFGLGLAILLHIAGSHAWTSSTALVGGSEENRMLLTARGLAVVSSLALSSGALAQNAVQWRVEDGGNGHWYQVVSTTGPITWSAAKLASETMGGYLVTLTSADEEDHVWSIASAPSAWVVIQFVTVGPWLGGTQAASSSSPTDRWSWVTGEPWTYTSWLAGEPNDGCGALPEDRLHYLALGSAPRRGWNDFAGETACPNYVLPRSYVVEWSADCNNDGIVDYGQIRAGQLIDTNANNVPDACELSTHIEVLELFADPKYVASAHHRDAIAATGYPWRIRDTRSGVEFVLVPSGEFTMGSQPSDTEAVADEFPAHAVVLTRPFYIARTEVTQAQWYAMTGTSPSYFGRRPNNPVERVSWLSAVAVAAQFGYRLPTEAEWEYACRAGSSSSRYGPINEIAWWGNGSGGSSGWGTNPVGTKLPNGFGLYDMIGNVWEYCQDFWGPYEAGLQTDPTGPSFGVERVIRGGDWFWPAIGNRSNYRLRITPEDVGLASHGVRFAMSPELTGLFDVTLIPDCNADGIADFHQCRNGILPDFNSNNVPDCCEIGIPCETGNYPSQWNGVEGANDHWYQLRVVADGVGWHEAQAFATTVGGHLASITSALENAFVFGIANIDAAFGGSPVVGPWLGGKRISSDEWEWVTGEPWSFTNWYPPNPDGPGLWNEDRTCLTAFGGQWNDFNASGNQPGLQARAFVVEWSADCNDDGVIDFGQIRAGQLADANGNNIPDSCEAITVPTDFPTVQAAIDSVPVGSQRVISVLPGTYTQPFSLNGKNVVIRGAADGTTILDGTGLPASIATFTGGEPATAGLENLVFRNGTEGSIIYKGALFKVGGAVYGRDSSAFIRNCRFEGNRSDYGGGAYLLYCNMTVEDCVFSSNTGISQGGGLMVFGTTGVVRNCSFTGNQCGIAGIGGGSAFKAAGTLNAGETVLFDGCTVTGNSSGVEGGAVEFYENVELNPGTLRIVNSTITGNRSGTGALNGAGGLMITGRMQSCIVDDGTVLCENLPRNVEGAFFIAGSPTICDCLADLNGDGVVSGGDLGLLLNAWGPTAPSGAGDVNHDGLVDGADLALMLNSWGFCQ